MCFRTRDVLGGHVQSDDVSQSALLDLCVNPML